MLRKIDGGYFLDMDNGVLEITDEEACQIYDYLRVEYSGINPEMQYIGFGLVTKEQIHGMHGSKYIFYAGYPGIEEVCNIEPIICECGGIIDVWGGMTDGSKECRSCGKSQELDNAEWKSVEKQRFDSRRFITLTEDKP